MINRAAAPLVLAAVFATAVACDGAGTSPSSTDPSSTEEVDEWGEDETPPTRDEILAAPAEHSEDAVAQALVEVSQDADTSALPQVLALASDEREEIRWHAVLALSAIGGNEAQAALARIAADDPSELVRDAAVQR